MHVRVVQNKEPDHFLLLFWGKMVVFSGRPVSVSEHGYDIEGTHLFHVRGTTYANCRAVELEAAARSLNSNDCFILRKPDHIYGWFGKVSACIEAAVKYSLSTMR